jgi:hypothetical protein
MIEQPNPWDEFATFDIKILLEWDLWYFLYLRYSLGKIKVFG